ncbi:MAG TPA: hypothetical protein VL371_16140 [Gemmataceae bacterium]|nr:hypothetical protein [Gemmataceae bacterium]
MCPDGSTVGRVPPSCEFAPCKSDEVVCPQDLKACPGGVYVNRYPPKCDFADCPPEHWAPEPPPVGPTCKNVCGNGSCDEIVCMAVGCPCAETKASCPQDCQ